MDKNLICSILIDATLCLMILLSYSFADHFELNIRAYDRNFYQKFEVKTKTHKRPINKIVKLRHNRFTTYNHFNREYTDVSTINTINAEISSWLILTGLVQNTIDEFYDIVLASLYPENLSNIGLPDEQHKTNGLTNNYRLHFEEDGQVFGEVATHLNHHIESYECSKIFGQSIGLDTVSELQTTDYVNRDLSQVFFATKSEAFISENHVVLISWNEVRIRKHNTHRRLRLRDTLGRETSLLYDKGPQRRTIYRSPRLVFWQPIDSSRETTDNYDLLECANSFSMVMLIIIMTLLLEIAKNGLEGKSKFSS